jgi:hypothetical protein
MKLLKTPFCGHFVGCPLAHACRIAANLPADLRSDDLRPRLRTYGIYTWLMVFGMGRTWSKLSKVWTLLSLTSALPILAVCLGSAAWNGVNFAVALYLLLSIAGVTGLFAGFFAATSRNKLLAWITCASASAIVALSFVFAYSFLCCRTAGVPLSDPLYFGRLHVPLIVLYGAAFLFCSIEALLFVLKII